MELQKKGINRKTTSVHNVNIVEVEKPFPLDIDTENSNIGKVEEKHQKIVILGEGETLRLLALELFGDKEFWVYIYQENLDIIPNPNRVKAGLKLKIPDIDKYFINNNDPKSISKAKLEGVKILNE